MDGGLPFFFFLVQQANIWMHMGGGCKQGEEEEESMIDFISEFRNELRTDDRKQKGLIKYRCTEIGKKSDKRCLTGGNYRT